jgi:hypothetical protein
MSIWDKQPKPSIAHERTERLVGIVVTALIVLLAMKTCDYGPNVDGGRPKWLFEANATGLNAGRGPAAYVPATVHYYEVSDENLRHPQELKTFFRFRCKETYLPALCIIYAWPIGTAPRNWPMFKRDSRRISLGYRLDRNTGDEAFVLHPGQPRAQRF